jgi:hypothetical protein
MGKRVGRPKNIDVRVREHLTPGEVETLAAQRKNADATDIATRSRSG